MTTIAVISVHPKWWEKIESRKKKYELRKSKPQQLGSTAYKEFYVYVTTPIKMVVGKFVSGEDNGWSGIDEMWDYLGKHSGMTHKQYKAYYKGSHLAYAISIASVEVFPTPIPLTDIFPDGYAPQSYRYAEV